MSADAGGGDSSESSPYCYCWHLRRWYYWHKHAGLLRKTLGLGTGREVPDSWGWRSTHQNWNPELKPGQFPNPDCSVWINDALIQVPGPLSPRDNPSVPSKTLSPLELEPPTFQR